ncbi:20012_t:CDS:2 [Rhizophagus irregularis]|nr:20012_t:CDS:2 [Rhizophagus irregularis]
MEETFERIRGQINSKLDNQKQISITLLAIEETIKEQDIEENNNIIGSILYLLNIVLKELPANILKNKYFTILTIFSTSFENIENNNDSLILRSIVGCLETLLSVQDDINVWQQFQTKKIFQNLLILSIDNRPKPRKKVHDSIKKILFSISKNNDEKSLGKFKHPAIDMTVEFCMKILKDYIKTDQTSVLHILSLLKGIIGIWTTENLYSLCEILINIPKYNQKYLTVSSFQLFEILFQNNSKGFILEEGNEGGNGGGNVQLQQLQLRQQVQQRQQHRFKELLISLTDLMPNIKDVQLLPQWLMIIARGFPIYVECNKNESEMMLQEFFIKIFGILESDNSDIIVSATVCLCELVSSGITDNMIQKELNYIKSNHQVQRESCLNIIISTLENTWLLPLLKDHIINSELGYFLKEFIPLSKRLQQKSLEFQKQNRLIESKIYDTLYQQIWSLLPGFCNLPIDLQKTFNKSTGELLSNTMYQQPDLRPIISLSLQKLVEKNKELLNSEKDDQELKKLLNIDKNDAKNNLDLISKHSNNYLAKL